MKKKDVLFLCQFFYPEYVSSATLPYDTAVALKNAGYSVGALCGYPHEYTDGEELPLKETVDGIYIHRVKYLQMDRKRFIGRLVNYFSLTFMMFLHLFEMGQYRTVIVYSNPPILPWVASWAKLLFGSRLVFVAYDLYPEIAINTGTLRDGNIICRLMNHINRVVYKRADRVVTLSDEMTDYVVGHRPIAREKVVPIPNWYADKGERKEDRQDNPFLNVTRGRFTVAYFGNMGIAQDMQTIMDAIVELKDDPNVCFLFAGHGNKVPQLKETIEIKKITNVYFYDFLKGQDFQDALQISDCALVSLADGLTGLCVPSKTYSYMMQGLPLLAVMDRCDIVRDIEVGAGYWVRNGEGYALAEAIRSMRADPAVHKAMRSSCREIYLEKYTTEICTNQYVTLFRELQETLG